MRIFHLAFKAFSIIFAAYMQAFLFYTTIYTNDPLSIKNVPLQICSAIIFSQPGLVKRYTTNQIFSSNVSEIT